MSRLPLLVASLVALSVALVGCEAAAPGSPEGGEQALFDESAEATASLVMRDVRFESTALEATVGGILEVSLSNDGRTEHDFTIERIDAEYGYRLDGEPPAVSGKGRAVHVRLRPGTTGTMRLRVNEPGEYVFFCDVGGHRRAGMAGTLTVR